MFRANDVGSYFRFVVPTMPDSSGIDSVFSSTIHLEKVNGIFYYRDTVDRGNYRYVTERMQYFIFAVKEKDTIHQVFNYDYEKRIAM